MATATRHDDSEFTAATVARLLSRAETAEAREERCIVLLRQLAARIRRIGGHSTPDEQLALWAAEALLVEVGR